MKLSTTALSSDQFLLHKQEPLSPLVLTAIAIAVCLFLVGGQLLSIPILILAIVPIVLALGYYVGGSGKRSLYVFIASALGLSFRMSVTRETDPLDLAAGAVIGGIAVGWIVRTLLIDRKPLTYSTPQLLSALYLAWGLVIGIGGVIWWNNTLNDWLREFLLLCSLLVIPLLYARFFEAESDAERSLHRFVIIAAVGTMFASVIKYAYVVSTAAYAYQIGRLAEESSPPVIFLLVCVAFAVYRIKWIPMYLQVLLGAFSVAILVLSGFRTMWVAAVVSIVLLLLLVDRSRWLPAIKFLSYLTGFLATIGTYLFFTIPLFKIYILMTFDRLLSTTELSTDVSLVNRYIETAAVQSMIAKSPIVGYGFGAQYQMFDWLLGYSYFTGFSHNGFFFVPFKTGIVGVALILSAYLWFLLRGFKIARDVSESLRTRAIAAVVFCYLVSQFVANATLNIFGERKVMLWVGLCWGFIVSREIKKRNRTAAPVTSEA